MERRDVADDYLGIRQRMADGGPSIEDLLCMRDHGRAEAALIAFSPFAIPASSRRHPGRSPDQSAKHFE
jgi:hypothetical protein